MSDWRRHFRREPTQHNRYCELLAEGRGHAEAYKAIYGEPPFSTMKECARWFFERGYSIRFIASICKLRFGVGSRSHIHRILNEDAYQKHLKYKRKKR